MRRYGQPRPRLEIIEAELDIGIVERDVGAALDVGRAAERIVDRLAVYCDVHHVKLVRALRTKLLNETRDIHTLVVVQRQRFVIHHLYANERLLALGEADVHDVVGLDVTTSLVFGPGTRQHRVLHDSVHSTARARRGKADVVTVHGGSAAV